jgi:hypothetical protein
MAPQRNRGLSKRNAEPRLVVPATADEQFAGTIYGQRFLLLQRQIAAGMDTGANSVDRRPPALPATAIRRAGPAFEDFLSAIGHTEERHGVIQSSSAEAREQAIAALEAMPRFYRSMASTEVLIRCGERPLDHRRHCGWWWCQLGKDHLEYRVWKGLGRALETLKRAGIDPWSTEVALVGSLWHEMAHRTSEKESYAKSSVGLRRILRSLDGMSDGARIVRTALAEMESSMVNVSGANDIGPSGGGHVDVGRRAAVEQAMVFNWKPAVVAAIAVIVAANFDGIDNFRGLTRSVGETLRRLRLSARIAK